MKHRSRRFFPSPLRRATLAGVLFLIIHGALQAGDANLVSLPPDLVAFWTFGEEAGQPRVSSVSPHALVDGNASQVTRVAGGPFSGFSAGFNGSTQFLRLPNAELGALNISGADAQVTVVAWVNETDSNTSFIGGIWQEDNNDPRRQYGLFLDLATYGGDEQVCGHVSWTGGPSPGLPYSRDYSANQTPVLPNQWVTVAFTYDGTSARSYLDGKYEARPTYTEIGPPQGQGLTYAKNPYLFPDGLGNNGGDFTVGAVKLTAGMNNHLNGRVGGLAVFSRALTRSELFLLHAAGLDAGAAACRFTYRNVGGSNATVAGQAWRAFRNATTEASNNTSNGWVLGPAAAVGAETGYLAKVTTGESGIAWTDSVPAIPVHLIQRFEFTLNHALAADRVRLAVKLNGAWYVSATAYGVTGDGRTAAIWTQAELKTLPHVRDAAAWLPLAFDAGSTLAITSSTPVALPAGDLEAIGFYQPTNAGTLRVDQLQIFVNLAELGNSTYDHWARARGLAGSTPTGDPDFDGVKNLLEYALAADPLHSEPGAELTTQLTTLGPDRFFDLTAVRRKSTGVDLRCEQSADLMLWEPLDAATVLGSASTDEGVLETIRWRVPADDRFFFRLQSTTP